LLLREACARKAEGFKIEAHNAEVTWWHTETDDPYGIDEVPEEYQQIGRQYFARAPGSDIWVCFDDLPNETSEALWEAPRARAGFSRRCAAS
jgi:hypothetical protein